MYVWGVMVFKLFVFFFINLIFLGLILKFNDFKNICLGGFSVL